MTSDDLALHGKVDSIAEKLAGHLASEEQWQRRIEERLDAHIREHEQLHSRIVGLVFTLIGASVIAVGGWLKTWFLGSPK